jgi:50S ribosomal subunit-associated GTPase HflX
VITILKELNFSPDFYTEKMVEVWNKVDLVEKGEKQDK